MNLTEQEDIIEIISRIPYDLCSGQTFVIAGASGFLGRYMVLTLMYLNQYILQNKCEIIALCRNENKAKSIFNSYIGEEHFHLLIQGVENEFPDMPKVDYIVHAASDAVTSKFELIPADILNANVVGTVNLLNLANKHKVKKFLFFSSGAVYGRTPNGVLELNEEDAFSLDFINVGNCYAEGKRAGEALCKAYWKQYGVKTVSVRISHTYGPGINLDDGRVFSDFVNKICKYENLVIKGDGNDVRPFCYISDAIVAFFLILFKGKDGEVYNMANSKETVTIRELAETLVYEAFPERNLKVEGKRLTQKVSNDKIKVNINKLMKMGWNPKVDIVEGFRRTVKSFEDSIETIRLI